MNEMQCRNCLQNKSVVQLHTAKCDKRKVLQKNNECNDFNAVNKTATENIGWTITAKYEKFSKLGTQQPFGTFQQ